MVGVALLETKFHAPRSRRGVVRRSRLLDRLNPHRLPALTLVSAPAGFGKTTLLSEWLTTSAGEARVAWVSLDDRDTDPRLFWSYVVAAVRVVAPDVGEDAVALLADGAPSLDGVLAAFVNDLARVEGELVVVLDDYHLVDSPEVHESATFVLEHLPAHVHLVLATRADPPWPLGRLRARGDLLEVRAADLRFTVDEAVSYLNGVMDLSLTEDEVEALEVRTEGWVAALQLAALSLQGRHDVAAFIAEFAGDDRFIVDYLADEVLDRQTAEIRRFLLHTSILGRLTGPLCDAVTGETTGKAMLEALERANLFVVPLDDRREWYRYHHLFADVLSVRVLDEEPGVVAVLHQRASDWYERNGERGEAISHALAAEDFSRAAKLIELAVSPMRQARQEATLRAWFDALPREVFTNRPVLTMGRVGALMASGKFDGVEALLDQVEALMGAPDASVDRIVVDDVEFARLPTQMAMFRAGLALLTGDTAGTIAHASRALERARDDDLLGRGAAAALLGLAYWSLGELDPAEVRYAESVRCFEQAEYYADVLGCARALADIQAARGRLGAAIATLESGLELVRAHGPLRGTADMHAGLSELFLERNDREAARRHARTSAELGDHLALPQNAYRWRLTEARLLQIDRDFVGALELLHEAEALYDTDYSPSTRPIPAVVARVHVARGDLAAARRWAASRGLSIDDEFSYLAEYEHVTLARLLLAEHVSASTGRALHDALALLDRLLTRVEAGQRSGTAIEILVLLALAHHAAGDTPSALDALEAALTRAEPEGYARVFLDEGPQMSALLQTAVRHGTAVEPSGRLLSASDDTATAPELRKVEPTGPALVQELSSRELEVLRLLRSQLSGPEIARELLVSLNTMRTHTKNIYLKLGVNNRRQAVQRAAELGL